MDLMILLIFGGLVLCGSIIGFPIGFYMGKSAAMDEYLIEDEMEWLEKADVLNAQIID